MLTIELIPKSAHGVNLRSRESKATWEQIKSATLTRAKGHCECCGAKAPPTKPLETHERWSWSEADATQSLIGTVALCKLCHLAKHIGVADKLGMTGKVHAHMIKVNGWSVDELSLHINRAWKEWSRLSTIQWTFTQSLADVLQAVDEFKPPA